MYDCVPVRLVHEHSMYKLKSVAIPLSSSSTTPSIYPVYCVQHDSIKQRINISTGASASTVHTLAPAAVSLMSNIRYRNCSVRLTTDCNQLNSYSSAILYNQLHSLMLQHCNGLRSLSVRLCSSSSTAMHKSERHVYKPCAYL
jgi:hypothetical protein